MVILRVVHWERSSYLVQMGRLVLLEEAQMGRLVLEVLLLADHMGRLVLLWEAQMVRLVLEALLMAAQMKKFLRRYLRRVYQGMWVWMQDHP